MPITEEGSNFPRILGPKNRPPTQIRSGPIGGMPMALARGETPVHLAQRVQRIIPRIVGRGRAGPVYPSSGSMSIAGDFETQVHNTLAKHAQLTESPLIPVLERPHPVLDMIKSRATLVPRKKLIGTFGIVDPLVEEGRNIPQVYPRPMGWPAGKDIGRLPSVIADISGVSGPERTTHPSISIEL